jgi:hypothetical protein
MRKNQEIVKLTVPMKELARYKFKHPRAMDKDLGKRFNYGKEWVCHIRHSKPYKQYFAQLEARKNKAVVEKLANFEVETIINGVVAQTYLGERLTEEIDPKDKVEKKMKDNIAVKAIDHLHRQIERTTKTPPLPGDGSNTVNIDNMQVNIETMPIEDLLEYIMKGSLPAKNDQLS